ncbi:MAG: quinate 5-dehydrogenase [Armatimonadota bacterium]|nr:quinate 5-dehydrogenase [Armatimonadota bacterium]
MPTSSEPLHVVSVSLGSTSRDSTAHATLLGQEFCIERRGTDGDLKKAHALIQELDGKVAAIGLGGIDLYVVAGARRYVMRDAARLAAAAKITPVVDGSGLKDTLERATVQRLQDEGIVDFRGKNVLVVSAVDRFGMAEELVAVGARCVFGDFLFNLGLNIPVRSLGTVRRLGALLLPVITKLPFKLLYPTGDKQKEIVNSAKHRAYYEAADIIAGDFLLIRRYLPDVLDDKIILTNTVRRADLDLLKEHGVRRLITTTPEFEGTSFGTNVMEGVFVALGARHPSEYLDLLRRLDWRPRVVDF